MLLLLEKLSWIFYADASRGGSGLPAATVEQIIVYNIM